MKVQTDKMDLYLFELGARTLIGYVDPDTLKDDDGNPFDIAEAEYVFVTYPAAVTNQMVPVPAAIQKPNQPVDMALTVVLFPYYSDRITVFVGNVMAVEKVYSGSYLHEEMKRIMEHWEKPVKGFHPRVV